jgi:hypothetical protein
VAAGEVDVVATDVVEPARAPPVDPDEQPATTTITDRLRSRTRLGLLGIRSVFATRDAKATAGMGPE